MYLYPLHLILQTGQGSVGKRKKKVWCHQHLDLVFSSILIKYKLATDGKKGKKSTSKEALGGGLLLVQRLDTYQYERVLAICFFFSLCNY